MALIRNPEFRRGIGLVIPAQTGIQVLQAHLDPGRRRGDRVGRRQFLKSTALGLYPGPSSAFRGMDSRVRGNDAIASDKAVSISGIRYMPGPTGSLQCGYWKFSKFLATGITGETGVR
jgi:hypothetical protein